MPTVNFHMTLSDGAEGSVMLLNSDIGAKIPLMFDQNGDAAAEVDADTGYTAAWELIDQPGDTIVVTWRSGAQGGTMITGSIIKQNSIPVTGGRRHARGMGYLFVEGA